MTAPLIQACQHCPVAIVEAEILVTDHDGADTRHPVWLDHSTRSPFCPGFPKGYQVHHKPMPVVI